jgi:hypothetical protein
VKREQGTAQELRAKALELQAIKTAMRASHEAYELTQAQPLPEPELDDQQRIELAFNAMVKLRRQAQEEGRVPKTAAEPLVDAVLRALIGQPQGIRVPGSYDVGSPYWDVAQWLSNIHYRRTPAEKSAMSEAHSAQQRNMAQPLSPDSAAAAACSADPEATGPYDEGPSSDPEVKATEVAREKRQMLRDHVAPAATAAASENPRLAGSAEAVANSVRSTDDVYLPPPASEGGPRFIGEFPNEPLGRLYYRIQERMKREQREARLKAAAERERERRTNGE